MKSRLASALCLLLWASFASAQVAAQVPATVVPYSPASVEPDGPVPTLLAQVQEVNLVLSVTDHRGRFVPRLLPSDLTILDDGQQQTAITFFQRQTDLPLDVALLIDTSSSVTYRLAAEEHTIQHFLKSVVRPMDQVSVFAFNQKVVLVAGISNNWKQVARRVKKLKPGGDTAIFDAVVRASSWLQQDHRLSRHIIILITDGEENSSKATEAKAIASALRAETSIYAVNVSYELFSREDKQGAAVLKELSDATGGLYFWQKGEGNGSDAFSKIRRELRTQYALAYRPSNLMQSVFHRIQVLAPGKLRVRCRSGYYVDQSVMAAVPRDKASPKPAPPAETGTVVDIAARLLNAADRH